MHKPRVAGAAFFPAESGRGYALTPYLETLKDFCGQFDKTNNYPLPKLYVSMLQRPGLDAAKFASSTGTMRGLEMA